VRLCSRQRGCQENWNKSLVSLAPELNLAILTQPKETVVDLRVAEVHDAGAITAVINLSFRVAESFLMDRDRMDLKSVPSLLQTGKFPLADQGGAVVGCVYVARKAERAYWVCCQSILGIRRRAPDPG
jgi:hypothetical protein